jgi:hypothetical protein
MLEPGPTRSPPGPLVPGGLNAGGIIKGDWPGLFLLKTQILTRYKDRPQYAVLREGGDSHPLRLGTGLSVIFNLSVLPFSLEEACSLYLGHILFAVLSVPMNQGYQTCPA